MATLTRDEATVWLERYGRAWETGGGRSVELDGAFRLLFERGPSGGILCNALQEWWHERRSRTRCGRAGQPDA